MSQSKVTEFFNTRKRARQEDVLLNKDKKLKSVDIEPVATRRSTRQQQAPTQNPEEFVKPKDVEPQVVVAPVAESSLSNAVNTKKKVSVEELKARIKNFNSKLQQHKDKYAEQTEQIVEVRNEVKEAEKQMGAQPAFEKHANLTSKEYEAKLVLPVKYQTLYEMFKGSDTVVKFMFNRQEICTFLRLKTSVQNITKKNFTNSHLAQIRTVYDNAYFFKYEKIFIDMKHDFHLTVAPNLETTSTVAQVNDNGVRQMTPIILLERLAKFKNRLLDIVKDCHQKFLHSIGVVVDSKDIKRWHAKFNLESVHDIQSSELPQPPNEVKCKTADDLRQIAQDIYSVKVKNAIEQFVEGNEDMAKKLDEANSKQTQTITKLTANYDAKRLNNFNNILEKVRVKERQKELENMVKNNDKEKRLQQLDKYIECVKFLKSYYQAEKKATIDIELICMKMFDSLRGVTQTASECEEIIRSLCAEFANWISIVKLRNIEYIKLNKNIELCEILGKIDSLKNEN